ncbi:MAG: hypothetical protein E2O39_03925 [Planctomycetota bacterium]|nr:MAG: hypothetical protein E2O39_03925 [Planctomycetota bacterium]
MLEALTLAALALVQIPGPVPLPDALRGEALQLTVQATETHFVAQNESGAAQVLFFGAADLGLVATLRLPPGARVVYPYSRGTIDGLLIEIVQLGRPGAWRNSGALAITEVRDSDAGTLWVVGAGEHLVGWQLQSDALAHLAPRTGLVPDALLEASAGSLHDFSVEALPSPSSHVPVVTPGDGDRGNKPPVIEERHLPPV